MACKCNHNLDPPLLNREADGAVGEEVICQSCLLRPTPQLDGPAGGSTSGVAPHTAAALVSQPRGDCELGRVRDLNNHGTETTRW